MARASKTNLNPPQHMPVLPLRDVVVFPNVVFPLFVGRERSIKAIMHAVEHDQTVFLVAQKNSVTEDPQFSDIYQYGSIGKILQLLKLPDGTVKVLIEGEKRAFINSWEEQGGFYVGAISELDKTITTIENEIGFVRVLRERFETLASHGRKISAELITTLQEIDNLNRLIDMIIGNIAMPLDRKQEFIETTDTQKRFDMALGVIDAELEIAEIEKRIRGRVKRQMEKNQREYYLNEQAKAIQKELTEGEDGASEMDELEKKIQNGRFSNDVRAKLSNELKKLKMMSPMSAEASVIRNYLDTVLSLPWKKNSKLSKDLKKAEQILEADHFGLEKVKERILEYLAVQQRVDKVKAPILCLVGPPGVGKTSLGQSIAKATNRKFVRMALGGVRDEAEIRGHRRTYIGSMPGKILHNLAKVGVSNPFFLLDEIDKLGQDFRGDPASALLEVLDPEQNHTFQDHYVEVDFDLSNVMFVATANSLDIPPALLDRMEIIRLSGYTEAEKQNIAERYLIPKQIKNNGLADNEITITTEAIIDILRFYTREAGVRSLEREISKICRKVVRILSLKKQKAPIVVNRDNLTDYLGVHRFDYGKAQHANQIGQVNGLAYTDFGGDLLTIEAAVMPGKGQILRTGSLGDVMKESVEAARTVVRARMLQWGIDADTFDKKDIHIHVPEGATPKDGPSAGAAMTVALVSVLTQIPVKSEVAMTGEITLRGEVLAIGGLKEKLLAAHRAGIKTVIIPKDNIKDLAEIPEMIKSALNIQPVQWIDEVLAISLTQVPTIQKGLVTPDKDLETVTSETVKVIPVKKNSSKRRPNIQPH